MTQQMAMNSPTAAPKHSGSIFQPRCAGPRKSDRGLRCIPPGNGGIRDDDETAVYGRVSCSPSVGQFWR